MVLAATIQGVWATLSEDMRESVPQGTIASITIAILVMGVAGRLIDQPKKKNKNVRNSNKST
jgi:hypothetical protein